MAPPLRLASVARLAGATTRSSALSKLVQTVATLRGRAVSFEDLPMLAADYVDEFPLSALRTSVASGDLDSRAPSGVISGMVFAVVARASVGARSARREKLDFNCE